MSEIEVQMSCIGEGFVELNAPEIVLAILDVGGNAVKINQF